MRWSSFLWLRGCEIPPQQTAAWQLCVFQCWGSISELKKRISFSKQSLQLLPLKVSNLLSLSALARNRGQSLRASAEPCYPNPIPSSSKTAVIQFPPGSAARRRPKWAGWECWVGDFCRIYTYIQFQGLKLGSPSPRLQLRLKGTSVVPVVGLSY